MKSAANHRGGHPEALLFKVADHGIIAGLFEVGRAFPQHITGLVDTYDAERS